ncbi:MAG: hypothetical protein HDQ87_05915 [Clostridia bacterium]|nr:hypothetical protein [Clostridia bacterium]
MRQFWRDFSVCSTTNILILSVLMLAGWFPLPRGGCDVLVLLVLAVQTGIGTLQSLWNRREQGFWVPAAVCQAAAAALSFVLFRVLLGLPFSAGLAVAVILAAAGALAAQAGMNILAAAAVAQSINEEIAVSRRGKRLAAGAQKEEKER